MKTFLLLVCTLLAFATFAQDKSAAAGMLKLGIKMNMGGGYWQQDDLNANLEKNGVPKTRDVLAVMGIGMTFQRNKLKLGVSSNFMGNYFIKRGETVSQRFAGFDVNGQYPIVKNKSIQVSPLLGVGYLAGYTSLRREMSNQTFANLISNRNTAEIFNHQGYVNAALVLGFKYLPNVDDHLYELSLGYRRGFAASNWSTDEMDETLLTKVSDDISQVYLQFSINMIRIRGKKK